LAQCKLVLASVSFGGFDFNAAILKREIKRVAQREVWAAAGSADTGLSFSSFLKL